MAAASGRAQHRHGCHASTNADLSTAALQQGFVAGDVVTAFDLIRMGVVEVDQVVVAR